MNPQIQFISIAPKELAEIIANSVKEQLDNIKPIAELEPLKKEILTRKEVAELFQVTLVTIHEWIRNNILKPYKMGNKTYFKYTEILETLYNTNKH
jgi:excisionase family DNA binding protein